MRRLSSCGNVHEASLQRRKKRSGLAAPQTIRSPRGPQPPGAEMLGVGAGRDSGDATEDPLQVRGAHAQPPRHRGEGDAPAGRGLEQPAGLFGKQDVRIPAHCIERLAAATGSDHHRSVAHAGI